MRATAWRSTLGSLIAFFGLLLFSTNLMADQENKENRQTPIIEIVGNGPLVPQSNYQSIPINFRNLSQVDVEILHVTNPDRFLNSYYLIDSFEPYQLDDLKHDYVSVFSDRYRLPPSKENKQTAARIPLPHNLASGWYIVVIKQPGDFYNLKAKHMLLTDIGIQARLNVHQASFSVTRLSTGEAIKSGLVEIYRDNKLFKTAPINAQGIASFDIIAKNTDTVVARVPKTSAAVDKSSQTDEIAILPLREAPLDLSDSQVGGRAYQPYEAFIYSNRDLVKPGESLPLNILLRDQDGETVSSQPITLKVLDPHNETILTEQLTPQAAGFYAREIRTTKKSLTGRYRVEVSLDPQAKKPIGQYFFEVEEFVPERMDLTFDAPATFAYAGQDNIVKLNGRYLFGSPADGNTVTTDLSYQSVRHFAGKYSDFIVGKNFSLADTYVELDRQDMSDEGTADIALPTPNPDDIESPVKTVANFSLLESGGAAVQRHLSFISWKNSSIAGIKPLQEDVGYDTNPEFDIALLSADGQQLVAGDVTIDYDYDRGSYYWVYEEGIGWDTVKQERWKRISSQQIKLEKGKSHKISLPAEWGDYRITITDNKTQAVTEYEFYAGWYHSGSQVSAKPEHLDIQFDQSAYLAGETIVANINAPITGSILMTLETNELIWSNRIQVNKGENSIEVPLTKDLKRHDIYLTATLTGNEDQTPKRYFGIKPVTLNRDNRKLDIDVSLPKIIRPLTRFTLPVNVSNLQSKQAQNTWVTVSLVDKGIINLSRFKPQNPFNYFFDQRRYSADVVDLYSRLYDLRPNPFAQSRFGSDAVGQIDNKNDDLVESKTIILMSKPVRLVNGKANISLDIPDYNGEGQLIVTAFNDTQVGQLVKNQTISTPIVAELSVPRFLIPGDKSSVTVDIHNTSGDTRSLNLALSGTDAIELDTKSLPAKVTLKNGEHVSYNLPFSVLPDMEYLNTRLRLEVNSKSSNPSDDIALDRSWTIPIRSMTPWVTMSDSSLIQPDSRMAAPQWLWDGLDTLNDYQGFAYISQTPILSVVEQARDLYRYPYGCAEQTTSKALPYLFSQPELTRFKTEAYKAYIKAKGGNPNTAVIPSDREMIAKAIITLKTMQTSKGGFSLWSINDYSYDSEQPWLTVYVTDFLIRAQQRFPGVVPKDMLQRAKQELQNYVKNPYKVKESAYDRRSADSALAYAAYVLSNQGLIQWSDLDNIHMDSYPSAMSYLQLVASYANVGDSDKAASMLKNYRSVQRYTGYFQDYGSNIRDDALSVLILEKLKKNSLLSQKAQQLQKSLLEGLVADSANKIWLSTQERGALLQAAILTQKLNQNQKFNIELNGQAQSYTGSFSVPLRKNTRITNNNAFPLYVKWQAEGYQIADPLISNKDNPLNTLRVNRLERMIYTLDGQRYTGSNVKVGDRLLILLKVNLDQQVNEALLADMIPAGFVLENPHLNKGLNVEQLLPSGESVSRPDHIEYRNDRLMLSDSFYRDSTYSFAYILRAEVPGTFVAPPVFVESMYSPDIHALYWQTPSTFTIEK